MNDYKINLFDFHGHNDFSIFPEPLRSFFGFLRCCTEKEAMKKYLEQNKTAFEHFDEATAKFLSSLTNIRGMEKYRKKEKGKVTYNMCKAFEDMRIEGLEQGRAQEREQGIRSLMENMELSLKQAMDALSIPVDEQPMYAAKIREQ